MATSKELIRQLQATLVIEEGGVWKASRSSDGWRVYRTDGRYAIQCTTLDGRTAWWTATKTWTGNTAEARLYAKRSSASSAIGSSVSQDVDGNYWSQYGSFDERASRASVKVVDAPLCDLEKLARVLKEEEA